MKPLELIIKHLADYWQTHNSLRRLSNDAQICGYEYCAEGAICNIFIKHASEEAAQVNAHWDGRLFCWNDTDGFGFPIKAKEGRFMPSVIVKWINRHHGEGVGEQLQIALSYLNDGRKRYSLDQISDLIAIKFDLRDIFGEAKQRGTKVFKDTLQLLPIA